MMKRYLLSIILGILSFTNFTYGQLEVNFVGATGNMNSTVDVDITVNGFTNMAGLSYTAEWDSLVMTFGEVVFTNPALPGFVDDFVSGPEGAALSEGQMTLSYANPAGDGTLADGDVLYTVRFNLVGEECATTEITLTNSVTSIEAFDVAFNLLDVTSSSEDIMINGTDCGGSGGGDELTITASTLTVASGGAVCVPLIVTNFNAAQSGSGTILWDPAVLSYDNLDNITITGVDNSLNTSNVANGELKFVWSNLDPANPLSINDGGSIFEICFTAVGNVGDMSVIALSESGSLGFEFADDDGAAFPQILTDGKVTIVEDSGPSFTLNVSDATVNQSTSPGCVDISVENFNNILSMQFVLTWDADILGDASAANFNLGGINANSFLFNNNDGSASFSWNGNVGVDVADNTNIFSLCFDLPNCDVSSPVQIVSQGSTNIEIIDGNTNEVENVSVDQGSLTVDCVTNDPCNGLSIASITGTCAGGTSGSVIINTGTACTYSWTNSAGMEIATSQNLMNVGVGVYTLSASCNGSICMSIIAEVNELSGPTINGTVTNVSCGELGAIDVSVTGGSGSYDYNWNPTQANSGNIANLEVGGYDLTVTDTDSGCTAIASFEVISVDTELVINSADVSDETCLENDGAISLNVSGGCMPYEFTWSDSDIGNTPNATNLAASVYSVTITDDLGGTVFGSYTIDGFTLPELDGPPVITPEIQGGGDGTLSIEVDGGTSPYAYNWSGPTANLPNSNMLTGLFSGDYTVVITDASGCEVILGPFFVPNSGGGDDPEFGEVEAFDLINGFGVRCNGDATGTISGSITSGLTPITVTLGGAKDSMIILESLGTFVFDNLAAGAYTVDAMNSESSVSAGMIDVTEPEAIIYDIEKGCDEEEQCDGFIDLNVSGGFGDLTITWSDPDLEGDSVDDLCEGNYVVTVIDENLCQKMESIDIESCNPSVPTGCYEVRNVITPNGDGMNETFAITCINDFPASLEVYDRWGALVYNQDVYDGQWSGISNSGDELIEGGYMYVLVIDFGQGNRQVMRGTITLLRD